MLLTKDPSIPPWQKGQWRYVARELLFTILKQIGILDSQISIPQGGLCALQQFKCRAGSECQQLSRWWIDEAMGRHRLQWHFAPTVIYGAAHYQCQNWHFEFEEPPSPDISFSTSRACTNSQVVLRLGMETKTLVVTPPATVYRIDPCISLCLIACLLSFLSFFAGTFVNSLGRM